MQFQISEDFSARCEKPREFASFQFLKPGELRKFGACIRQVSAFQGLSGPFRAFQDQHRSQNGTKELHQLPALREAQSISDFEGWIPTAFV